MKLAVKNKEGFETQMILNNRIRGVLPVSPFMMDGELFLHYREEGCSALENDRTPIPAAMREVIRRGALLESLVKEYMLKPSMILLEEDQIFVSHETGRVYFCLDPESGTGLEEKLLKLTEYAIRRVDHSDSAGADLMYRLHSRAAQPGCTFGALMEIMESDVKDARSASRLNGIQAEGKQHCAFQTEEERIMEEMGLEAGALSFPDDFEINSEDKEREGDDCDDGDEPTLLLGGVTDVPDIHEIYKELEEENKEEEGKWYEKLLKKARPYTFEIVLGIITAVGIILILLL